MDNVDIPIELTKAVEEIEWDLSDTGILKKASARMVEICSSESSPIDFPSDIAKAKMEIGTLMLQNRDKTANEILHMIIQKYGIKTKNVEVAKARTEKLENLCTVPANAGVYEVLKELSDLYFKEKNTNAAITYKKVSQAVKDLDFEITMDNAKGLGKVSVVLTISLLTYCM